MDSTKSKKRKSEKGMRKNKRASDSNIANDSEPSSKRKRESESSHKNKKSKQQGEEAVLNSTSVDIPIKQEPASSWMAVNNPSRMAQIEPELSATPLPHEATPGPELSSTPAGTQLPYRVGRAGQDKGKRIGPFQAEETKKLEDYKVNYCNSHGIDAGTFDMLVQHSEREYFDLPWPTHICGTKVEFWAELQKVLPERGTRSVYRFARRHFRDKEQKPHDWTEEQDDELIRLFLAHGPKYAYVAKLLGRSDDDVTQRWKNKLEYRAYFRGGPWTVEETRRLLEALEQVRQSAPELMAFKDVYEMDVRLIPWGMVSDLMNHMRSRKQCSDRWRKLQRHVFRLRIEDPNAVLHPEYAPGVSRVKAPYYAYKPFKSDDRIRDDSSDDNQEKEAINASEYPTVSAEVPTNVRAIWDSVQLASETNSVSENGEDGGAISTGLEDRNSTEAASEEAPQNLEESVKRQRVEDKKFAEAEQHSSLVAQDSEIADLTKKKKKNKDKKARKEKKKHRKSQMATENAGDDAADVTSPTKNRKHHRKSESRLDSTVSGDHDSAGLSKKEKKRAKRRSEAQQERNDDNDN
ncbi:hypothetical protein N7532_004291 [Penicillium argentinense]|uniref:Uncharacterized protein n=1 Tax=Penicillium argentinense TaxID=1131581 RepID=A0A9W9FPP0_9EURO|nr:uncharacterized protein N7532_004291 [Penicillium argentinense]KAJ5103762.1 hypothetical protein N7532_004291 [Penicillium argentinense]